MTLALILLCLWLLAALFAWVLMASAKLNDHLRDSMWPELVDEEGRR